MIYIVDDFYPNPDKVREKALKEFFYPGRKGTKTMFPGDRTLGRITLENFLYVKNRLETIIGKRMIHFPRDNSNTAFTLGKETKHSLLNWVHHDCAHLTEAITKEFDGKAWASVCYLSPDAPATHGTALFMSEKSGKYIRQTTIHMVYPLSKIFGSMEMLQKERIFKCIVIFLTYITD